MGVIQRESIITCPVCGHRYRMTMTAGRSLTVATCPVCGAKLTPKPGECCVPCSFGTVPCPTVQRPELAERQIEDSEEQP